jgi:hypothetical protein
MANRLKAIGLIRTGVQAIARSKRMMPKKSITQRKISLEGGKPP